MSTNLMYIVHPVNDLSFFQYRFAVQLLAPAAISAKISGRSAITTDDIKDIGELFLVSVN